MRFILRYFIFSIFSLLLLSACNPSNDITLLLSYPKDGHCSIDSPERGSVIKMGEELLVSGWAYNSINKKMPETMAMYFLNEENQKIYTTTVKRDEKREDVAKAMNNADLVDSGFRGTIEKKNLPPGKYQLILLQIDPHTGVISCAGDAHRVILE